MENKIDRIQHSDYSTPIIPKRKLIQCVSGHLKLDIFLILYQIVLRLILRKKTNRHFITFLQK
jgi:hypothetical protein